MEDENKYKYEDIENFLKELPRVCPKCGVTPELYTYTAPPIEISKETGWFVNHGVGITLVCKCCNFQELIPAGDASNTDILVEKTKGLIDRWKTKTSSN